MSLVVLPRLEVVADPQVAEAGLLGRMGLVDELCCGELLVLDAKPTPGPDGGGGGAAGVDGEPAGCLERLQAAASPAAPTTLASAASWPNERRDIPLMRLGLPGIRHGVNGGGRSRH